MEILFPHGKFSMERLSHVTPYPRTFSPQLEEDPTENVCLFPNNHYYM